LVVNALLEHTFVRKSILPFQFAEAVHDTMEMKLATGRWVTAADFFGGPDIDDDEFDALVNSWALPPPLDDVKLSWPQHIVDSDITYEGQPLAVLHGEGNGRQNWLRTPTAVAYPIHRKKGVQAQDSTYSGKFSNTSPDSTATPVTPKDRKTQESQRQPNNVNFVLAKPGCAKVAEDAPATGLHEIEYLRIRHVSVDRLVDSLMNTA
jgi:hypothetical protein